MFRKAERKASKLRLALIGPSGSGKTYSALLIAEGLGGKIALLDTERGSGSLYSHLVDYDVCEITAPFTPQKYIDVIQAAEASGYGTLIVDSLTHCWAGQGGLLDMHDTVTKSSRSGNSFMAWREVTPHHNRLVDTLLQSGMHIIMTLRTKTSYEVQDDGRGKKVPVKIGLAPIFRDGIEYEATLVLDLSINGHVASSSKDRTGLFDGQFFTPDRSTGEKLMSWINGDQAVQEDNGDTPPEPQPAKKNPVVPMPAPKAPQVQTKAGTTVIDLFNVLRELGLADQAECYEEYLSRKYGHGSRELSAEQVTEQFVSLSRCRRDAAKLKQLTDYFALLENYRKAA
jgi:hypothetical protein